MLLLLSPRPCSGLLPHLTAPQLPRSPAPQLRPTCRAAPLPRRRPDLRAAGRPGALLQPRGSAGHPGSAAAEPPGPPAAGGGSGAGAQRLRSGGGGGRGGAGAQPLAARRAGGGRGRGGGRALLGAAGRRRRRPAGALLLLEPGGEGRFHPGLQGKHPARASFALWAPLCLACASACLWRLLWPARCEVPLGTDHRR